jgi:hypothetical protein
MRRLLATAVAVTLAVATQATARPACPFLADFARDTDDASLDLLAADLATTGHGLAVRVRLAALAAPDTASPLGTAYLLEFTVPHHPAGLGDLDGYAVWAVLPTGLPASGGWGTGTYGGITTSGTATVRVSGATVTVTAPTGAFGKAMLGNVRVTAYRLLAPGTAAAQPFYGLSVDRADTTRGYRGGSPGCVAVRL